MHYRKIYQLFSWVAFGILLILLALPLVGYQYTLSLLDEMPKKPDKFLTQPEFVRVWSAYETFNPEECASISPYWVYRWAAVSTINDALMPIDSNIAYKNASKMASRIAISHIRKGHLGNVRVLWSHLTTVFLSIWLQRNWSANEIASKFKLIESSTPALRSIRLG